MCLLISLPKTSESTVCVLCVCFQYWNFLHSFNQITRKSICVCFLFLFLRLLLAIISFFPPNSFTQCDLVVLLFTIIKKIRLSFLYYNFFDTFLSIQTVHRKKLCTRFCWSTSSSSFYYSFSWTFQKKRCIACLCMYVFLSTFMRFCNRYTLQMLLTHILWAFFKI